MALSRLQVTDFRCLQAADLELDGGFTLISGANGSGKTSLLEAIHVLGRGRSFRTRHVEKLIRTGCERFVVFGEVAHSGRRTGLGVEGSAAGTRARLAGEKTSTLAELASILPVQIIDPEVHRLIEEGPSRRRRFLDWGVFHVEPTFLGAWQRFQQALRQRNAGLKGRQPRAVISAWDGDLIRYGEQVSVARSNYVDLLAAQASQIGRNLLGQDLTLHYRPGWSRDLPFAEALLHSWSADMEWGSTQVGPQRAELVVRLDGVVVKERISRGQQKLLAAALLMAQLQLFPREAPIRPSLLLDDPAAELDGTRLASLISEVSSQSVQLIVTTLQDEFSAFGSPGRRYRVRDGIVDPA